MEMFVSARTNSSGSCSILTRLYISILYGTSLLIFSSTDNPLSPHIVSHSRMIVLILSAFISSRQRCSNTSSTLGGRCFLRDFIFFEVRWHRSAALTGVAHSCFLSYSLWWQAMSRSVCPKGRWRYANLPSCPRLLLYTLRESDSRETIFGGCWAKTLYEFPKWHRIGRQLTLSNGNSNCFYLSFCSFFIMRVVKFIDLLWIKFPQSIRKITKSRNNPSI